MKNITRRNFLKSSLITATTLSLPARLWAQSPGANGDIRAAVIGFGGRGAGHISELRKAKGVRIVALCDCDKDILERAAKNLSNNGQTIETYTDVRKLLENKDVDVITTATPNHWHSLIVVWGCQAGKDVYVEKPISHNVWEGRKAFEASRKYNRIVQAGTQSRSNGSLREALEWVRAGNLGKIKVSRGLCYKRRASIGKVDGPQAIPPQIDYDLWCGPALKLPLMRKKLHYDWHWVWNTGNGDLGNQGIHQMDIARWALGKNELSSTIISVGGRFGYIDDGETFNTQFAIHDYGDSLLIFEVRGLPARPSADTQEGPDSKKTRDQMDKLKGQDIGNIVECENGYLAGPGGGWTAYDNDGKAIKKFSNGGEEHMANFIKAVRSRKREDQNADILEGHLSSALCHTSNLTCRLGSQAEPEQIREALKTNKAGLETMQRFEEHLARHKVDLKLTKANLGAVLQMSPKTERFTNNDQGNELLTRPYRAPFIVPEKV